MESYDEGEVVAIVEAVLGENQEAVQKYQNGQKQVIGFFVGEVLKRVGKKVDVGQIKNLIENQLSGSSKSS